MTDYSELVKALRSASTVSTAWEKLMHDAAAAIEDLQAQLPKQGEWELIDEAEPMRWGCSRCKYLSWETSNYCPRCGAKMEVQE